jgi:hypothetical protein
MPDGAAYVIRLREGMDWCVEFKIRQISPSDAASTYRSTLQVRGLIQLLASSASTAGPQDENTLLKIGAGSASMLAISAAFLTD